MNQENFAPPLKTMIEFFVNEDDEDLTFFSAVIKPGFELKYNKLDETWELDNALQFKLPNQSWDRMNTEGPLFRDLVNKYFDLTPTDWTGSEQPPIVYTSPYPKYFTHEIWCRYYTAIQGGLLTTDDTDLLTPTPRDDTNIEFTLALSDTLKGRIQYGDVDCGNFDCSYGWYIETDECWILFPPTLYMDDAWNIMIKPLNTENNEISIFDVPDWTKYRKVPWREYFQIDKIKSTEEEGYDDPGWLIEGGIENEYLYVVTT